MLNKLLQLLGLKQEFLNPYVSSSSGGPSTWVDATPSQAPSKPQNIGLAQQIASGISGYAPQSPLIQQAQSLAQLGQQTPDPLLAAVLALKESSGLNPSNPNSRAMAQANNPFGIKPGGVLAEYPDLITAILGGGPKKQRGLKGVLSSGAYDKYLKSGDLADFFAAYTPEGPGNPTIKQSIEQYNKLRKYFD